MTLRVNARRARSRVISPLSPAPGWPARRRAGSPSGLLRPVPVGRLPGSTAARSRSRTQRPARRRAAAGGPARPGARVLDACAAPGGKTAQLLERADLEVLAIDRDPARLARVDATLARLGLAARTVAADAARPEAWWDGRPFQAILLDAPCSASGIVRRHPDVRWLRRASDIPALAATQARLLDALWPLLAPGGRLLYCTCSLFRAEGQDQIDAFLQRHGDAFLPASPPSPGHLLPLPDNDETPAGRPVGRRCRRLFPDADRETPRHAEFMISPPPPGSLRRRSLLRAFGAAALRVLPVWGAGAAFLAGAPPARASAAELTAFDLSRDEDGVYLSYAVEFELGRSVDDALVKSVPLFFVAEAEIFRDRWYWRDRRVAHAVRTWRIVYQPLTSTYRVTTVGGLSQTYATRAEAIASISRASRWKVAEPGQLEEGGPPLRRIPVPARHQPSCRGRCRSASAANPTGSFRSSAHCASTESPSDADHGAPPSPPGSALPGLTPASRWAWIISTVAALGAAVVLAFLLSIATNSPSCTSATTSGCSGSTSAWRACWSR
jgi:SAM-dependent methyltransferase